MPLISSRIVCIDDTTLIVRTEISEEHGVCKVVRFHRGVADPHTQWVSRGWRRN